MTTVDKIAYLSPSEYENAKDTLREFTVLALHWLARQSQEELKDQIIGDVLARGDLPLHLPRETTCDKSQFLLPLFETKLGV